MKTHLTMTLARSIHAVRRALRTQLALQQNLISRHDRSGLETRDAAQALRWQGDRLVGDRLPHV